MIVSVLVTLSLIEIHVYNNNDCIKIFSHLVGSQMMMTMTVMMMIMTFISLGEGGGRESGQGT